MQSRVMTEMISPYMHFAIADIINLEYLRGNAFLMIHTVTGQIFNPIFYLFPVFVLQFNIDMSNNLFV